MVDGGRPPLMRPITPHENQTERQPNKH
jgi:hypothetical protein